MNNGIQVSTTDTTIEHTVLRGVLRRQMSDYLLEERPLPADSPWKVAPIRRVAVVEASPINLAEYLGKEIVIGTREFYDTSRRTMVMFIDWIRSAEPGA